VRGKAGVRQELALIAPEPALVAFDRPETALERVLALPAWLDGLAALLARHHHAHRTHDALDIPVPRQLVAQHDRLAQVAPVASDEAATCAAGGRAGKRVW
jgi:hypothetical protein